MSTTAASLNEMSRLLFIYVGLGLFLIGIFGCIANIYLFSMRRYRKISCSLFMWIRTVVDLLVLLIALLFYRLLNTILRFQWMAANPILCKVYIYLLDALLLMPIWCICLSAFDRYCMTSRNAARRRWSTTKTSRIMITALIVICLIYRSFDLYYVDVISAVDPPICNFVASSIIYTNFHSYFTFPVVLTTAPIVLLMLLSFGIRNNLRSFVAQQTGARLERQMALMVLLQALGAVCVLPYTIYLFYSLGTKTVVKSEHRLAVENMVYQITLLCFYGQYSLSFYIYLIAAPDLRQTIRRGWEKVKGEIRFTNQVAPKSVATHRSEEANVAT